MCVRARTPVDPWLGSSILEGRDPDGRLGLALLLPEPCSEHKARKVPGNFSSISGHKRELSLVSLFQVYTGRSHMDTALYPIQHALLKDYQGCSIWWEKRSVHLRQSLKTHVSS